MQLLGEIQLLGGTRLRVNNVEKRGSPKNLLQRCHILDGWGNDATSWLGYVGITSHVTNMIHPNVPTLEKTSKGRWSYSQAIEEAIHKSRCVWKPKGDLGLHGPSEPRTFHG